MSDGKRCGTVRPNAYAKGCGQLKPLSEFYKENRMASGYSALCKDCSKKRAESRYYNEKRRSKEVGKLPPKPLFCELCGGVGNSRGLNIDHDHVTGKFRGWLCWRCNFGVAWLEEHDNIEFLAREYLRAKPDKEVEHLFVEYDRKRLIVREIKSA